MRSSNPDREAKWRERVEAWHASGLTGAQFAQQLDLSLSSLARWAVRLRPAPRRTGSAAEPPPKPAFVQVVREKPAPSHDLVVEGRGARVHVAPGFDPALLAAVVRALGDLP